jgi:hypothetical protein
MLGFGALPSAQRFWRAFEEVRQYFRPRRKQNEAISLHQRQTTVSVPSTRTGSTVRCGITSYIPEFKPADFTYVDVPSSDSLDLLTPTSFKRLQRKSSLVRGACRSTFVAWPATCLKERSDLSGCQNFQQLKRIRRCIQFATFLPEWQRLQKLRR